MMHNFAAGCQAVRAAYAAREYGQAQALLAELQPLCRTVGEQFFYEEAAGNTLFQLAQLEAAQAHMAAGVALPVATPELRARQRRLCSNWLMYLHYLPGVSDAQMLAAHRRYGELFAGVRPRIYTAAERARRAQKRRLRIGYLSPDFYEHIVTNFAIQLYAGFDRARYEVFLYDTGGEQNDVTDWLRSFVTDYVSLRGLYGEAAAARIAADDIDILVDLAGHTEGGRGLVTMAWRAAPVQVSGIGYFDTTGLPQVDYFLTDGYCTPRGGSGGFIERPLRLPHSHFCYTPPEAVRAATRPYQLHTPVVFGSFNNFAKINLPLLLLWRDILARVPGSRLLLRHTNANPYQLARVRRLVLAAGLPLARVTIEPGAPGRDYLDHYQDMDIALDTYPYPGGGTTCEALYMGVPVVTRYGTRHGTRFGLSLLTNAGLGELAAPTPEVYVATAVALAQDTELLVSLHQQLRTMLQQSPVMDARAYVHDVEQAYERIWQAWLDEM